MTRLGDWSSQPASKRKPKQEGWGYDRTGYLGASDSALILGLSRWGTALDVYRDKVGESEPDELSLSARIGLDLERSVQQLYRERTGTTLRRSNRLFRHPELEYIGCHPDFTGPGGLLVEAKTSASFRGWGEEPDGSVPTDYWVQVQHQMLVTGSPMVDIAVLFLGWRKDFRVYRVPRHDVFIGQLTAELVAFWTEHVVPRLPPEVDGSTRTQAWLTAKHPVGSGLIKPATAEQQLLAQDLRATRAVKLDAELREAELKNRVRDIIGDDTGLRGPGFTFTWSQVKAGAPVVNWKGVSDAYRSILIDHALDNELGDDYLAELQAIVDLHTGPGTAATRRLRLDFNDDEETDE